MQYEVKAVRAPDGITALSIDAADDKDAAAQARAQGYAVLGVQQRRASLQWRPGTDGKFPLAIFSQELLALLNAGLTLVEAFETLVEKEPRPAYRKMLQQVIADLYEGKPLSLALTRFPAAFPALYVATVQASEKTSSLAEALSRYVAYQAQVDLARKKIVSASIYPVLLLAAGGLVTSFLMLYVVPRFSRIYQDLGSELPFFSQLLMNWGQLLEAHRSWVLAGLLIALAAIAYGVTQPAFQQALLTVLWRIPALGRRLRIYQLARFYRALGMLLRGGIAVVPALGMVAGMLPPVMRGQLARATAQIREGRTISQSMEQQGMTTPVALRMLRVGERTGAMGDMMERIAAFYEDDMARWVDWFTRLFEPLLMALIGFVIGFIVILMYFPIFELAGSLQ